MPPKAATYIADHTTDQRSLLHSHLRERGYLRSGKPTHNPITPIDGAKFKDFSHRPTDQSGILGNLNLNDQDDFGKSEKFQKSHKSSSATHIDELAPRNLAVPDFKPTAKYVYPIERRPRGKFPVLEFALTIFLLIAGTFFVGVCYWSYLTQKQHEFTPFLVFAAITLVPGLYQGSIFFCAIFDLNEITYNDIPRAPGWS